MTGERLKVWARALRVDQWTKNGLVLMAWFFAVADASGGDFVRGGRSLPMALGMAVSFSLVSSAFYLLNDVWDFAADKLHPVKRLRPVAAGLIPRGAAVRASLVLLAAGFAYPALLLAQDPARMLAFGTVLAYTAMQFLYTGFLKRVPYLDVATLSLGFVLRAVAGAAIVTTDISAWLLTCTFTLAMFLALCKRKDELETARESRAVLRNYHPKVLDALIIFAGAASFAEYLAYALCSRVGQAFPHLWVSSLFVLAGIVRYAQLAWMRRGTGRPEKILLTDRILWVILSGYGLTAILVVVFH